MSVASRLKRLLDVNGHSYAEAERATGVSRETIRRIATGQEPPKLAAYLRKIAAGYGIEELALLEGATPKGEFEWNLRSASPAQRLEWFLMSPAGRVRLTIDFLRARYPHVVAHRILAAASGMSEEALRNLIEGWHSSPPDRRVAEDLAQALHALTGIGFSWFQWGGLSETWQPGIAGLARVSRWSKSPSLAKDLMSIVAEDWTTPA